VAAIGEQRWAEFVRRALALRESAPQGLLPDLMPVLVVNEPDAFEMHLARRERTYEAAAVQAPGGNFAVVRLNNPALSGALLVTDRIAYSVDAVGGVLFQVAASATPVTVKGNAADARASPNVTPISIGGLASNAAGAGPGAGAWAENNIVAADLNKTHLALGGPYVIPPGFGLFVMASLNTMTLTVLARWTERAVDSVELSPTGA